MSDTVMKVKDELPWAFVRDYYNERALDDKSWVQDPTKLRQGTWAPTGYLAAFSGDRLSGDPNDPVRHEKVLLAFKIDQDFPPGSDGGCLEVFLQRPNTVGDKDMIRILTLTTRYAQFHVPILGFNTQPPPPPPTIPSTLQSPDGRFSLAMQGDGNLVIYDNSTGAPVWASDSVTP